MKNGKNGDVDRKSEKLKGKVEKSEISERTSEGQKEKNEPRLKVKKVKETIGEREDLKEF